MKVVLVLALVIAAVYAQPFFCANQHIPCTERGRDYDKDKAFCTKDLDTLNYNWMCSSCEVKHAQCSKIANATLQRNCLGIPMPAECIILGRELTKAPKAPKAPKK